MSAALTLARCLAILALIAGPALAADPPTPQMTVAYFSELQERGPSTPEELAERAKSTSAEAAAADSALNDWKLCTVDAIGHWADLGQGPGTLVDGAFGRCGDLARLYRDKLLIVKQGSRLLIDLQFARALIRSLEEAWRPRLIAMALDQELARKVAKAAATQPTPAASSKSKG
jgi:hypothetical protein